MALAIGLLFVLPRGDEYRALRSQHAALGDELARYREELARLPAIEELAAKKQARLDELAGRAVAADQVHVFRGRIVELSRDSGCQVRHILLGERRLREWRPGDDPLSALERPAQETRSPYLLGVQSMSISVSGPLASVKQFLKLMRDERRLIHTKRVALQPAAEPSEVVLEMEVLLFELTYEKPPAA